MLRDEYSCTGHILGNFGPEVLALGGLKHGTFFEIFPLQFQAGYKTSRFSHRYISTESERLDGFRRTIAYWKRIVKG